MSLCQNKEKTDMKPKFRHYISATEDYSVTVAWKIDDVFLSKDENDVCSPYFSASVGLSFQRRKPYESTKTFEKIKKDKEGNVISKSIVTVKRISRDNFSKKFGRNQALDRMNGSYMKIRLYADETIDHAIAREILKFTSEQISSLKIPQKFYNELLKTCETPVPFYNVDFSISSKDNSISYRITHK